MRADEPNNPFFDFCLAIGEYMPLAVFICGLIAACVLGALVATL